MRGKEAIVRDGHDKKRCGKGVREWRDGIGKGDKGEGQAVVGKDKNGGKRKEI